MKSGRTKKERKKPETMNLILIVLGITLLAYTVTVLIVYWHTGGEPSTLTACLFGLCTAEGGFMSHIQTTKTKTSAAAEEKKSTGRGAPEWKEGDDL